MAYVFTNQGVGKAQITDDSDGNLTLAGINTSSDNADQFMEGISQMLGIVNWSVQDAVRVVNQNVEEE